MRIIRFLILMFLVLTGSSSGYSQNADQIIARYIQAIGGTEVVSNLKSLVLESSSKFMMFKANTVTTVLNGKGYKSETKAMGREIIQCFNEKGGWMSGISKEKNTEEMSRSQYMAGRQQMFIGSPFLDYKAKGFKTSYLGREMVGDVNAYKISLVKSATETDQYWFDPATGYLIKSLQKTSREDNPVEIVTLYTDYYKTKIGYVLPLTLEMDISGRMSVKSKITKVIVDQPVNATIFIKPI